MNYPYWPMRDYTLAALRREKKHAEGLERQQGEGARCWGEALAYEIGYVLHLQGLSVTSSGCSRRKDSAIAQSQHTGRCVEKTSGNSSGGTAPH